MNNDSKQKAGERLPLRMSKSKCPKLPSCLKKLKRTPERKHKTVGFSSHLEYIPISPFPDSESRDNSSQTRSCTSMPTKRHPAGHSICIPRKPVPANPKLVHPVPMCNRKSTLIPPLDLESLTDSSGSGALPWLCTDVPSNDHEQLPLPSLEIEAAQFRIEAFIDSKEYRQFVADQSLVESHLATYLYVPKASPNSIMGSEEFSIVRPTSWPTSPSRPRMLRRVATPRAPQPDLRQRFSLRAEVRKVLSSCNSNSCSTHSSNNRRERAYQRSSAPVPITDSRLNQPVTERNSSPEDWYPPRKFRPGQWKPADEIMNGEEVDRHYSMGRLAGYTRSLLCSI